MNVEVCLVRMVEHVLMTSTAMIVHVSLALLMYIVKQVHNEKINRQNMQWLFLVGIIQHMALW